MLPVIIWLYVLGGIGLYALSADLGEPEDGWLFISIVLWPVVMTVSIVVGILDFIVSGIRGVIGK